jgi:curli production assembly/transport component CsgG
MNAATFFDSPPDGSHHASSQALCRVARNALLLCFALALGGCAGMLGRKPETIGTPSTLAPVSDTHRDLTNLPPAKGKIIAAVFGFRDQSGQYKPAPSSSFSTAVTQGAASILVKALLDSNWFVPVEREGLNNLLTERKIIRAANAQPSQDDLPSLLSANILIEGGIVGYESNVRTGGLGVKYLGVGSSDLYRIDQVTVNLRAVDIRTGRVLNSVSTTKTIYSVQLDIGVFRFVRYKKLLELEGGFSYNEPAQLCVTDAIEAAVINLIAQGLNSNSWRLANAEDIKSPVLAPYVEGLAEQQKPAPRSEPATLAQAGGGTEATQAAVMP